MHDELNDLVVVVEVCLAPVDVDFIDDWVKEPIVIYEKRALEVDVKIFDQKLNRGRGWQNPSVDSLSCINFPILNSWEINFNQWEVLKPICQLNFDVFHIKVDIFIGDVGPVDNPTQVTQFWQDFVVERLWENFVLLVINVLWKELLHHGSH